jgi:hypothetical protein
MPLEGRPAKKHPYEHRIVHDLLGLHATLIDKYRTAAKTIVRVKVNRSLDLEHVAMDGRTLSEVNASDNAAGAPDGSAFIIDQIALRRVPHDPHLVSDSESVSGEDSFIDVLRDQWSVTKAIEFVEGDAQHEKVFEVRIVRRLRLDRVLLVERQRHRGLIRRKDPKGFHLAAGVREHMGSSNPIERARGCH